MLPIVTFSDFVLHASAPGGGALQHSGLAFSYSTMDDIFRKWTALSDEYQRQVVLLRRGDKTARQEARRLAKELEALSLLMRDAPQGPRDRMTPGIYEVKFTTAAGAHGMGAVVIKGKFFVGADGIHYYRGDIHREGPQITVLMEVTRHNFAVASALGSQSLFTLKWRGCVGDDSGFSLECLPPASDVTVYVTGTLLQAAGQA